MSKPYLQIYTHQLVQLLRQRFAPPAWALFEQVANGTGFSVRRHADAVAMGIWPSRGLEIHGFEIKISRGDWRKEFKNPEKADVMAASCDRWWLVVPNENIVSDGELPAAWGLLIADANGKKLVAKKEAPLIRTKLKAFGIDTKVSRQFLAAILRRAFETQETLEKAAFARGVEKGIADGPQEHERRMKALEADVLRLENRIADFERASGVQIDEWNSGQLGEAVKLVQSEYFRAPSQLKTLKDGAEKLVEIIGKELAIAEKLAGMGGENGRASLREAARR